MRLTTYYFIAFALFLGSGLVVAFYAGEPESPISVASEVAQGLKRELRKVDQDFDQLKSDDSYPADYDPAYPLFVYKNQKLLYWTDNIYVPSVTQVLDSFDTKIIRTGSAAYLLKKRTLNANTFAVSALQLVRKYPISNDYLATEYNQKILPSSNISVLEPSSTLGTEVCIDGKCYLRISFLPGAIPTHTHLRILSTILLAFAVVFFLLTVYAILPYFKKRYPDLGFIYLVVVFYGVRLLMTQTGFPRNFVRSALFDPQVFAASNLNASLGDLLINVLAVLLLCFYLFRNYYRFYLLRYITHDNGSWVITIIASLGILFATLFPVVVIQTLYNNSNLVLDITQSLRFNSLRIVAIFTVLISGVCTFLFAHIFVRILSSVPSKTKIISSLAIASVVFVLINLLNNQQYVSSLVVAWIYLITISLLKVYRSLKVLTFNTFAYLFIAILFLAINCAIAIQYFTHKEKIENQFRFANNFLIERDDFAEYLLNETSSKISKDIFIQTRLSNPFLGKEPIRQKIRQVFLPRYFDKYDIKILIFNSVGQPIDTNGKTLTDFLSAYNKDAFATKYKDIRFINNPQSDVTQKYLVVVPIKRLSINNGYILIELSLKKIIPENVYPELLVDYRFQHSYRTQDLSYAVYSNENLAFSSGEFNYERFLKKAQLQDSLLCTEGISLGKFDHIAVKDDNGRVAVVSTLQTTFIQKLSNFSFFLVIGLMLILLLIFIQGIYQYVRGSRLFFSARIQLYLNLAFFIPLIIVSVSTLSLTSKSSQQQLNDEYLNKSEIFSRQMTNYLEEANGKVPNAVSITGRLNQLAELTDLDANIYNPFGVLVATSQPIIFESNLLSSYVNAKAYLRVKDGEILFIESEKVGALEYFVSYAALKSANTGKLIGILGIPFFQSAYLLERIQSVILINILNIFAFIFIVLLLLSYVVADRLTFPLRFITQSLRRTSLTQNNTPLTWPAEDEIGLMVKEYNSMLFKLGESKSELEQTQREKAWREIAQQVAHEIKNPLTPMKLTLQQLERAVLAGNNTQEKTSRAVTTLLEQVDTLNNIASSFSGFAKMPEPMIETLDMVNVVRQAVNLHSPTGQITFKSVAKQAMVMGDVQLLSRTFSNIIINGLQSGTPGENTHVSVSVDAIQEYYRVTIADNGRGMTDEVAKKVFLPHFTTKRSGSGLGLAIAKQAIEQMKGRIWFDTKPGKGTSFYVELPVIKS